MLTRLRPRRVWQAVLSRPVATGANAQLAWTGLLLGVLTPLVLLLPLVPAGKFVVVLAFACFAPGAALLAHVRLGNAVAAWAMALVLSLALFAIDSAVLVWTANWHPYASLWGLAALSVGSAALALTPAFAGRRPAGPPAGSVAGPPAGPVPSRRPAGEPADWTAQPAYLPSAEMTQIFTGGLLPDKPDSPEQTQVISGGVANRPASVEMTQVISGMTQVISLGIPPEQGPPGAGKQPKAAGAPSIPLVLRLVSVTFGPVFLAASVLYWIASLLKSSTANVNDYGLLAAMHPTYFIAIAVGVFGFLVEIARGARRTWLLVGHLVVMILLLHATVPALVYEPEYAWTYKHIGVIELFKTRGGIVNVLDIYQAWPTFFAAVAQLSVLSGLDTMRIAAWAPVFFDTANCLPLFAIVRSLTHDRRLPYLTVFLFTCINWVAQDYLSPQAFAYVLCLGVVLIMLRWLRRVPGKADVWPRWLGRLWTWLHNGLAEVPYVSRRAERAALLGLYLVYLVVVISHQLSPYLIALSATALVVLGLIRSWQIAPILLGIAVMYLLPNYEVVDHYGLFGGFNIFNTFFHSTQGTAANIVGTAGKARSAQAVQILSVLIWGLSALSAFTARQRLGAVAAPAVLAFAPFALLFGQGYGGEAIYRVFLFSVPWCAYLIAVLALRLSRIPRVAGVAGATVLLTAATLASLQGAHGQLVFDQFTPAEVRTAQYAYTHMPAGSTLFVAADNLPGKLTANYGDIRGPVNLKDSLPPDRATITPDDLASLNERAGGYEHPVFLMLSRGMAAYNHYFGYLPDGQLASLNAALSTSPQWQVFYRTPDAVVYRFVKD